MENTCKLWEELSKLDQEEFLDKSDYEDFNYYLSDPCCVLMEMANVVGNKVRVEDRLPFSFHFCDKDAVHQRHGIRLKIIWNPSIAPNNVDGYLKLHGDWEYISGSHKYKPTGRELEILRNFGRKYKVLFAAVWEKALDADPLQDYFKGNIDFPELLRNFKLKGRNYFNVNHCKNLNELEQCVRQNKIFSMND